jgi:hypothetical protein
MRWGQALEDALLRHRLLKVARLARFDPAADHKSTRNLQASDQAKRGLCLTFAAIHSVTAATRSVVSVLLSVRARGVHDA